MNKRFPESVALWPTYECYVFCLRCDVDVSRAHHSNCEQWLQLTCLQFIYYMFNYSSCSSGLRGGQLGHRCNRSTPKNVTSVMMTLNMCEVGLLPKANHALCHTGSKIHASCHI